MNADISFGYADGGHACCIIKYQGMEFVGEATCHPEDKDFESERIGLTIAEARANIKVLQFIRKFEIKPQLKILNHLYTNMKTSTHFTPDSYEAKMLRSQINALKKELEMIENDIKYEKKFVKDYIDGKNKMHQRLRAKNM